MGDVSEISERRRTCRFCEAPLVLSLIDLGCQPLSNAYLPDTPEARAAERRFPLHARVCETCWLVQLDHDAPPEAIFDHDYAYLSSYSASWVAHAGRYAREMTAGLGLGARSRVIEIASNDGYLLRHFVEAGIPVLGIEPAGHAGEIARAHGVETRTAFFNEASARALAAEGITAELMAANNVLAHVPDIRDFVAGVPHVLAPEGVMTFEFPHLLNLIEKVQFDTIYHEHYCYLSLLAVEQVLASAGLRAFDVETLRTHGGSLRVHVCHRDARWTDRPGLMAARRAEDDAGLARRETYLGFTARAERLRDGFLDLLSAEEARGGSTAAYGAAAKGNTFLNFCAAGSDRISMVADRNPQKQGRLLPGTHIPVVAPEALVAAHPSLVVILPWNLRDEIAAKLAPLSDAGVRLAVIDASAPGGIAFV